MKPIRSYGSSLVVKNKTAEKVKKNMFAIRIKFIIFLLYIELVEDTENQKLSLSFF